MVRRKKTKVVLENMKPTDPGKRFSTYIQLPLFPSSEPTDREREKKVPCAQCEVLLEIARLLKQGRYSDYYGAYYDLHCKIDPRLDKRIRI